MKRRSANPETHDLREIEIVSIYSQITFLAILVMNLVETIWEDIADLLPKPSFRAGCGELQDKLFLEAVFWLSENGGRWDDLPSRFGDPKIAYRRFHRWAWQGTWTRIFDRLASSISCPYRFDGRYILHESCEPPHGLRIPRRHLSRNGVRLTAEARSSGSLFYQRTLHLTRA